MNPEKHFFIFDLDNTLGIKRPFYTDIPKESVGFLKKLSTAGHILGFATDRPRSLTFLSMQRAGLTQEEIEKLFAIRIYEDGLLSEVNQSVVYDALDHAPALYRDLKKICFNSDAVDFFKKNGFDLHPSSAIDNFEGVFAEVDYEHNPIGEIKIDKNIPSVYRQDNIVRETYKFPDYFFPDLESLDCNLDKLYNLIEQYLSLKTDKWKEVALLKKWKDSIDVYPKIDGEINRKGKALADTLVHLNLDKNTPLWICCDGENDIPLVDFAKQNFPNYRVVCPSNIKTSLKDYLEQNKINFFITEEDCTRFNEGLNKLIIEKELI